eukprot:CCRYP_010580-RB/>CCRYP_010580-RB protein AED:0.07 eAED:0.12 QI:2641/0.5/0.66/1/0/0/3/0/64
MPPTVRVDRINLRSMEDTKSKRTQKNALVFPEENNEQLYYRLLVTAQQSISHVAKQQITSSSKN